jgi:AraC-like DNA-binding protein
MRLRAEPVSPVACYREFAPREDLGEHVRAFFSFGPPAEAMGPATRRVTLQILLAKDDPFVAPSFADANPSIVVNLGRRMGPDRVWGNAGALSANVLGPMTAVAPPPPRGHAVMVGVYFQPARALPFTGLPLSELTDRILPLDKLWGPTSADLPAELDAMSEAARIDRLESHLVERLCRRREPGTRIDVPGLAAWARRSRGQVSVERLAEAAGVSRQHLTRVFHELVGVSPKLYCRMARFRSALGLAAAGERGGWAGVAAALGYADQSHMIAEFREFSSLTPQQIADARVFHPFIESARSFNNRRGPVA